MMTAFDELDGNYTDVDWVNGNAHELYLIFKEKIKDKKSLNILINKLLLFYPYLMERDDLRRWAKIADRIVRKVRKRKPPKSVPAILRVYVLNPVAAHRIKPIKDNSNRLNQRKMLEVYFELLMMQMMNRNLPDVIPFVASGMKFVRIINDQYYYAKFYQNLAFILASSGDFYKALDFSKLGYAYFKQMNEQLEAALSAYSIAIAYRGLNHDADALKWFDVAGECFFNLEDYPVQQAMVLLDAASLYLRVKDYETAFDRVEMGLNTAIAINHHHCLIASAYLLMSQIKTGMNDFDVARDSAEKALQIWQESDNLYQTVIVEQQIAFIDARMGHDGDALVRLSNVLQQSKMIAQSDQRNYIIQTSKRLISAIEDGKDPFEIGQQN